jgi:O-acetylhomoserine (thiol)-lyase
MKPRTKAIHGGYAGDPVTGATVVPLYQTAAYAYGTAEELADVFSGRAPGDVYTRISNPTTQALEKRLAELEAGRKGPVTGCIATASGMAAITATMMGLLRAGDEILSANGIFGGTMSLFTSTLGRFGVTTTYANADKADSFGKSINERTKVVFLESIGNPRMNVPDIEGIAQVAHEHNIPLVLDSTLTPPPIMQAGPFGAGIVVFSTSKYINGHGTAIGGALIDTGNYDWGRGLFPDLRQAALRLGRFAFLGHLRKVIYRDLGGCPAPMNSFLMLQGLETLVPRMELHCANAHNLATRLSAHPQVAWVNYPGLPSSPYNDRTVRGFGGRAGGMLTFSLGTRQRAMAFINALRLAKNMTNIGDAKTLVLHPATTIYQEYTEEERNAVGVHDDMLRVSVGIEDIDDIIEDFEQAIAAVTHFARTAKEAT